MRSATPQGADEIRASDQGNRFTCPFFPFEDRGFLRRVLSVLCDGPIAMKALMSLLPDCSEPILMEALQELELRGISRRVTMRAHPLKQAFLLSDQGERWRPELRHLTRTVPPVNSSPTDAPRAQRPSRTSRSLTALPAGQ